MSELPKKCLAEALATFMLCFIGAGAIVSDAAFDGIGLLAIAVAHGLALSIAVSATMNVSGGHINPAVNRGDAGHRADHREQRRCLHRGAAHRCHDRRGGPCS